MINNIIELRQFLHKFPEISNREYNTSRAISVFMENLSPDEVFDLSRTGKAFVFNGQEPGPTLMFRAELDALPITETNQTGYISEFQGISHACGHDGHMAILAGLAEKIAENRPLNGRVILIYQPAEEVEQGAREVVKDLISNHLEPDYIFALHNIPGLKQHQIALKSGSFAAASKGMTVKLTGKTSHAAEPENGINPAMAISMIIKSLNDLISSKHLFSDLTLLTIIHISLGEISFGTSPGYAEIRVTLRAFENADMEILTQEIEQRIHAIALQEKLACVISYSEEFPATENNGECVQIALHSAKSNGLDIKILEKPFKWSEDFAYYTERYKGCLFGLGAGENRPQLHNPDYDFPDEILETGIKMFYSIYKTIIKLKNE